MQKMMEIRFLQHYLQKAYVDNKSWTLGQVNTILGAQSLPSAVIEQKIKRYSSFFGWSGKENVC